MFEKNLNVYTSSQSTGIRDKSNLGLHDLTLQLASQILCESASPLERAIASRILGQKCANFRVLTIDDCLADMICEGGEWRERIKNIRHLGYSVELASLVLYILVQDGRFLDAQKLFDLVNKTELALQRRGYCFTDVYAEIMTWIADKMNLTYSPPKKYIKVADDYSMIIKTVLNFGNEIDAQEMSKIKHVARQKLLRALHGIGVCDIVMLYFTWELSRLLFIPQLPLKDQLSFVRKRYYVNQIKCTTLRYLPEIMAVIAGVAINAISWSYLAYSIPLVVYLFLSITVRKLVPSLSKKIGDYVLKHWGYLRELKSRIEKDRNLITKLEKFIS